MKKFLTVASIILFILIIYVMFEIKFGFHRKISSIIEIEVPITAKIERQDTHGGMVMDGETLARVYFTDEQAKKVLNEIKNNKHWRELPIMERLQEGIIFNIDKSMEFPIVENGYWFYLDRHTEANDIYDEYERYEEKRSSTNFSVAVFDSDSNILYYYALDT